MRPDAPLPHRLACVLLASTLVVAAPVRAQSPSIVAQARGTVASAADKIWHGTQDLAAYALGLIGVSYRYGGATPEAGLDCSGLVYYVFQQVTGVTLPRTAKEMSRIGGAVAKHELEPGDLVFFDTRRFAFSHVGIYLGGDRFIHAPRRGREVEIANFGNNYWQKHFNGARRLVGFVPMLVPTIIPAAEAAVIDAMVDAEGPTSTRD